MRYSPRRRAAQDARGKDALWKGADAIVIDTGKYDEDAMYLRSTSLHNWLFGLEMPDTVIVVTETMLYVLGSAKKVAIIEPLQSKRPSDAKLSVLCYTRSKADKDASNYATLVEKVKGSHDGRAVAMLLKEEPKGDPAERWRTALRGATAEQLDLGPMVGELLARKDAAEQTLVKRAALFSAKLLEEYVVGEIENLVDRKIDKPHSDLATKIEDVIGSDTLLSQLKIPPNKIPDPNNLDTAYTPIIQSGGVFNLKPSAESTDDPLHHGDGVITVSLGGRYRAYCANIGRTYVINPTKAQAAEYATLLAAHEAAVGALKPGRPASDALQAAVDAVRGRDPALVPKLTKNVGFATGLEFRDASFVLNAKNTRSVEEGMVFNVALGLENLENPRAKSAKERAYAMFLAETVLVGEGGAEVLTTGCTRAWAQVSYQIADEDEGPAAGESRGKENKPKPPGKSSASKVELTHSRTRGKNQQQAAAQLDEQLREHQKELEESITRDALRRLERGGEGGRGGGAKSSALAVPTAYPSHDALPRDLKYTQTVVDAKANAVLIPIFGTVVPFHITTIKNVTRSEEGQFTYLRINFNPPGQGLNTPKDAAPLIEQFKLHDCVREVTLKARDPKNLNTTHRLIKELRSRVMKENKEQDEKRGLVAQEPLRMTSGGRVNRLRDVNMRPHPSGRKSQGLLELHQNGVRYTSNKGERVDITFKNMRNCFFQPAQKEHIVLIHFHLHDGIMIGKKKHADVQFYVEVIEMSQALDQGRRGGGDGDELEEEQRERALRNRMNQEFQSFAKKLEEQVRRRRRARHARRSPPARARTRGARRGATCGDPVRPPRPYAPHLPGLRSAAYRRARRPAHPRARAVRRDRVRHPVPRARLQRPGQQDLVLHHAHGERPRRADRAAMAGGEYLGHRDCAL